MRDDLVVHCKRATADVYVGRPSKWGNPFHVGRDGTREEVIGRYRRWLLTQPELVQALPDLAGKTLGCWCAPRPCHGDVLARLADAAAVPAEPAGRCGAARAFLAAALAGRWVGETLLEVAGEDNEVVVEFDPDITTTIDGEATLWLFDISVTVHGQALGTRALQALRAFSDATSTTLIVGPVVSGYFARPDQAWLEEIGDEHGDPVLAYQPRRR